MLLPSFLQRKAKSPANRKRLAAAAAAASADDSGPAQAARTRASRRLIGAVVLLAIGIVGFPLVFETQPRPIPVDIRIDAPASAAVAVRPVVTSPPIQTTPPKAPPPAVITESAADAGQEVPPPAASAPVRAATATLVASAAADDGARAKALLDGGSAASEPKAARFVVQVGAFTDPVALREARQKVERLGLKTYTQIIETDAGKRTRVRVGPFASREEADQTGAKLKSAGLPVAILVL